MCVFADKTVFFKYRIVCTQCLGVLTAANFIQYYVLLSLFRSVVNSSISV